MEKRVPTLASCLARFPGCIGSQHKHKSDGKTRSHKNHWSWVREHVGFRLLDQPPAVSRIQGQYRQIHVRPEPYEARARRARSQNRTRKAGTHEPTSSQMVFVGTRFPIGLPMQPGNRAGQLASCPARFPGCIGRPVVRLAFPAALVVRWENAVCPVVWLAFPAALVLW